MNELISILDNHKLFIDGILKKLEELNVDVSTMNMDHIGYQASSNDDYDRLKREFGKIGNFVSEEILGGRRVGIYKLNKPLTHKQYAPEAIELVAPKDGQTPPSALEHVEFVLTEPFESFMKRYPNIPWDTKDMNRQDFPMLKLKLGEDIQVKFHLQSVLEIVEN
jgi:predicted metalloenzyme YecM